MTLSNSCYGRLSKTWRARENGKVFPVSSSLSKEYPWYSLSLEFIQNIFPWEICWLFRRNFNNVSCNWHILAKPVRFWFGNAAQVYFEYFLLLLSCIGQAILLDYISHDTISFPPSLPPALKRRQVYHGVPGHGTLWEMLSGRKFDQEWTIGRLSNETTIPISYSWSLSKLNYHSS